MAGLRLMAELGLDGSGFEAGLKRAEGLAHGVAEGLKSFAIQAIGVLTVEQAIAKTVETAKELVETSKRLAIAPEQLQVMRQAAKDAGVELGDVAKFIEKIDIAREKSLLRQGIEPMQMRRTFGALGVTQDQLRTMTGAQLMMGPISQAAQNRNPEELGAIFRSLGLRDFGAMIPVLKTNFSELQKEMEKFGGILKTEDIIALKGFSDTVDLASQVVISNLAPALVSLAEWIFKFVGQIAAAITYLTGILNTKEKTGLGPVDAFQKAQIARARLEADASGVSKYDDPAVKKADEEFLQKYESVFDDAAVKFDQVDEKWKAQLEGIKAKIEKAAEDLRHPKPAHFDSSSLPEHINAKALESHADSLTKVGNFLGGMGIAGQIEQKKIDLLTSIDSGIKIMAHGLSITGHSTTRQNIEAAMGFKADFFHGTHFPH